MCGICGLAAADPRQVPLDELTLHAMTDALVHRGPDEDGHTREPGIALGMRRLSIIDVETNHQPVRSEDGSVIAVFNGEIYNFEALRRELSAKGHRFVTRGDSETIVHLYEEHGIDFVKRLRGMFAIALWDGPRRRLVLARDRMGVKPLYYALTPDGLAFASEAKALIVGGLVRPELDPLAAELFLAHGFVPGPRSLFANVRKLAPAAILVFEAGKIVGGGEREYWNAWEGGEERSRSATWQDDQEQLLELLNESVRARMVSDVPIGVMLSGGLDSSLITALMTRHSTERVRTFSIGFLEDAGSDELDDARAVAQRLGTEHQELRTSAVDHPDLLDEAIWHLEEPIADVSCLGFLLLSRMARRDVTVALCGMGADELLGGYRKHEIAALATLARRVVPSALRLAAASAARRPPHRSTLARGMLAVTTDSPVERLLAMSRVVQTNERATLLNPTFMQDGAEAEIASVVRANLPPVALSPLGETLFLDGRLALVDNMHLYVDKMSMAASLEVRVPFMDHDVVSFCSRLPDSRRVWHLHRKELLKRASAGLVGDSTIAKRKQGFFHTALSSWLTVHRDGFVRDSLLDAQATGRGLYRDEAVRKLVVQEDLSNKKTSQRLFCLLALERWQRMFIDKSSTLATGVEDRLVVGS